MRRNVRARIEPGVDPRITPRPQSDLAAIQDLLPAERPLHRFLHFIDDTDRADRDKLLERARHYGYMPMRQLSWEPLHTLGLYDRARDLCDRHWRALFAISESASETLTIEFLSTLHILTPLPDYHTEAGLTFRLGGVERRMSLRQFAVAMGLYTEEELDTPAFAEGLTELPEGTTVYSVWAELSDEGYKTPNPKSSEFRDPTIRILHRAIAHGISCRGNSAVGNVMQYDLFYLHCMTHHLPCQLAERLARFLFQVRHGKHNQAIFGGGYITVLAKYLGVEFPALPDLPLLVASPKVINMTVLQSMGVVVRQGLSGYVLRPRERPAPVAPMPPQIRPGTHDSEAGPSGTVGGDEIAGGQDQAHEFTQEHHTSEATIPPSTRPSFSIPDIPQPPITRTFTRDYGPRLARLEESVASIRASQAATDEILRVQFTHDAAYRDFMTQTVQLLAATIAPGVTLPQPPVLPQQLQDFIRPTHPSQPPSSPPQQPPADP